MTKILSLGLVRGLIAGILVGAVAMGIAMIIRKAMGLPPWDPATVSAVGVLAGVPAYLTALGAFTYWKRWALGHKNPEEHEGNPYPTPYHWSRYFNFDHNHKIIGVQYLATSLILMLIAMSLAVMVRVELSFAGNTIMGPGTYNKVMSLHGITMIAVILIGISGIINYALPLLIGAKDMVFPRLNALSYWFIPPAAIFLIISFPLGGFDTGWTAYPPLSAIAPLGMQFMFMAVYLVGLSSILGGINFVTTIVKSRAPGMSYFRMPIFVWGVLATALITITATQFIAMAFLMVLLERLLGMGFFDPGLGGNAILFQHLFWFYSHPAVYVFVLPGLAVIAELLPVFVRKPLFGYRAVALSSLAIAIVGFFVWGHHMFVSGMEDYLLIPFMITTLLVAVPTGVKVFSWVATMWGGKIRLTTPFLFVLSAITVFLVGGLTGVPLALVPTNIHSHDSMWVVAHFHNTFFGGFLFPLIAAIYYWFPKITGRLFNEKLGKLHWGLITPGFFLMTLPLFWLGLMGMRRRIADTTMAFEPMNQLATIGGLMVYISMLIFAYNLITSILRGPKAPANPWEGKTLEWQVSSPPPEENFETPPRVVGPPYGYGNPGTRHAELAMSKEER